jgi:hypothetical protein
MSVHSETKFSETLPEMSVGAPSDYLLLQMRYNAGVNAQPMTNEAKKKKTLND